MSLYAEGTSVPVEKSRVDIERLITKYGASHYGVMSEPGRARVLFQTKGRNVCFELPLPSPRDWTGRPAAVERACDAETRRRWRALLMVIKAKFEAVASKITSFDEEFLAHLVMEDGRTVAETMIPQLPPATSNVRALPGKSEGGR